MSLLLPYRLRHATSTVPKAVVPRLARVCAWQDVDGGRRPT